MLAFCAASPIRQPQPSPGSSALNLELIALLAALGLLAAFFSGLLGIGGGLIVVPLLLYVPQALGLPGFDIKAASAIAVAQVAVAAGSGTFANIRRGNVYWR